jgi:opacity protein-like surface antigen
MTRFYRVLALATLTSGAALLAQAPASAADIYRGAGSLKDAPIVIPPTWTGFYIGGHLGALFNDNGNKKFDYDDVYKKGKYDYYDKGGVDSKGYDYWVNGYDFFHHDENDTDFAGGIHLGYNWQRPGSTVVWGIEGDLSFSDNVDYLASIRARLGVASDNALLYLTAGVAFIEFDNDFRLDWDKSIYKDYVFAKKKNGSDSETGWVIGGGAEFKLTQKVSFGVEGLYYSFDADGTRYDIYDRYGGEDIFVGTYKGDDDFDFWQIRARLAFHTGGHYGPLP